MLDKNEGIAVVGLVIIALVSLYLIGVDAKDIALTIGAGLVVFIRGRANKE